MSYTNDPKPSSSYSEDSKPSSSTFVDDTKPMISTGDTWFTILTSWEGEIRTWSQTDSVAGYTNDLK